MRGFAKKTRQIMAFAVAMAMLLMPAAQAAGQCTGFCHTKGRYKSVGNAGVTRLHSHGAHGSTGSPFSLLDPIPGAATLAPVDLSKGCKARIAAASCAMTSFRSPLVAIQGSHPEAVRVYRLLTVSAYLQAPETEPEKLSNGCFEADRTATSRAAPTPLFLKNLALLI